MSPILIFTLVVLEIGLTFGEPEWDYRGPAGPKNWARIYPECAGVRQSPIDLNNFTDFDKPDLSWSGFDDTPKIMRLRNNGRTLQLTSEGVEPRITTSSGKVYNLSHVQFHWGKEDSQGSEHTLEGKRFAMEMQAVYLRVDKEVDDPEDQEILITATFMEPKPRHGNVGMRKLFDAVYSVTEPNRGAWLDPFPWSELLHPFDGDFVWYQGSLTTPPCIEGVTFVVNRKPQFLTHDLMKLFREVLNERRQRVANNFRPLQKREGRPIYLKKD